MKYLRIILCTTLFFVQSVGAQSPGYPSFWARTAGKLPTLSYGLGEDRLGGAKMGYLDTSVLLKVVDTAKSMFQVQLSKNRYAYIDKAFIVVDTNALDKPLTPFPYTSNSIIAKGDSLFDYVSIRLPEKLPYQSWMDINPSKIIIEIFGVASNTNWITQLSSLQEVKNVYYHQVDDDILRVTVELNHKQHWGYSLQYSSKGLELIVRRQPQDLDLTKMVIAIDAGHGGTNSGADGIRTKVKEKNATLLFAKELEKHLRDAGIENVIMTRQNDTSFDNKDRILWLQSQLPHVLISLHLNSSGNTQIKGTSTYYKHVGFRPLTQTILSRMLELGLNEFGNIGSFNFALSQPTEFPNCLVEIAFLSNLDDEQKIISPQFHKDVAKKIHAGMQDWIRRMDR
jgi:N-acetylmuramoyl-L-alanine amidase